MTEHPIRLRNSLTGRKEAFVPIDWTRDMPDESRRVRMYVCGPTVYDRAHIGNARPVVVFDVLFRLLRRLYGPERVIYARNITDIDDKIIDRARLAGRPIEDITRETAAWFAEDMAALGALAPTLQPRATEWVGRMIAMIETLIARGHAYEAEGHVLFSVDSWPQYGALSRRSVEDMIAGARVEVAPYKKNPMDFVLWKPSTPEQPGWDSPWGRGRPGWHIECSAMAQELLGADFDIHGGGADLIFPHHENEIAQSCCAAPGSGFAHVWMHNGMIRVDGRKMSKSLGNFITVKDLRDEIHPQVIRLTLLSVHYRKTLDWTAQRVAEMAEWLASAIAATPPDWNGEELGPVPEQVMRRLCNDLDTHGAFVEIGLLRTAAGPGGRDDAEASRQVASALAFLGFDRSWLTAREGAAARRRERAAPLVERLLEERRAARAARDFARADAIRDLFKAAGVLVKDTPQGAEWELGPDFDPAKLENAQ
ncbi:cysteine--tRNA ligase [Oceanicella actignis]|uniref:Cysteine--tRNA ligase n=1 Tax=Oceanicella actignis TaxID=1189325 RepID=A0A1M7RU67_9RHOB|nr:cysteine--tRNA ligase [Oceanicella actignis]SET03495.1 cysteinyl-tRNA synthetase [Oceanicella actignis]SHN49801.1 cysteinyl-tRNA synthetase [Oceanicella actignis]